MTKEEELLDPNSCFNKAKPDELMFVLLECDPCAPMAIRVWATLRRGIGLNKTQDAQIQNAIRIADMMEKAQNERNNKSS